jgi:hypothetical protein
MTMRLILVLLYIVFPIFCFAQPGGGGDPGGGQPVPISGFEILIGAGAILGARRLVSSRKKKYF